MPFLATETLMMEAVKRGADRQDAHEVVRTHAREVAHQIKENGSANDLLERLSNEPLFAGVDLLCVSDPINLVGRAPEQVDEFCSSVARPVQQRYSDGELQIAQLRV